MVRVRAAKAMAMWMAVAVLLGLPRGAADAADSKDSLSAKDRAAIEGVVRDYLNEHPEVLLDAIKALEAKQRAQHAESARQAILAEQDALKKDPAAFVAGNPNGDVTIVEFFDYNCPYCRTVASTLQTLLADDKKLRLVIKEWPVKGPDSLAVAQVSLAAAKQPQFLAFHFALLASEGHVDEANALETAKKVGLDMDKLKKDMKAIDAMSIIKRNDDLATKIGIDGTPGFVIGTTLVPGAISADKFKKVIASVRESCKTANC